MTTPSIAAMGFSAPKVAGLDDVTQGLLEELVRQWAAKMPRNVERLLPGGQEPAQGSPDRPSWMSWRS